MDICIALKMYIDVGGGDKIYIHFKISYDIIAFFYFVILNQ